ncbi:MAG: cell wall metabolism sensor histidine kinase WalK, partial [Actinomycetota bacterium]|nr:cell wall metabolism sensor histidine kinase WalK [Actinomycetota bacterium]
HFTVEFLGFLMTAGAAFLVLSRPSLIPGEAFNRITAALGFTVLAVAQVAHGGAFVVGSVDATPDGAEFLVAGRGLGYALLLIAVVGGLRAAPAAGAALALREPLLLVPAGAAALLSIMALAAARVESAMRRLAGAAFLIAASEALTASAPSEVFGTGDVDTLAYLAHGLRAGGYLLLGSWLWTGIRSSIRIRFVASFVALLVAVVLALSTALTGVISSNVEQNELARVKEQARSTARSIAEDEPAELQEMIQSSIGRFEGELAGRMRNQTNLDAEAANVAGLLPSVDFVLLQPSAGALAKAGEGPSVRRGSEITERPLEVADGVRIMGTDLVTADASFSVFGGLERVENSVVILAGTQIGDPQNPAGVVVVGQWVDVLTMEAITNRLRPTRASLVVNGRTVASDLPPKLPRRRLVPPSSDIETTGVPFATQQTLGDRAFYSGVAALTRPNREVIGEIVLSSPASIVSQTREGVTRILFVVAMGVGAVAMVLAWLSGRRFTRPIQQLTATAGKVREGDLTAQAVVHGEDEVGQLGETFNEMTASLLRMTDDLRDAAQEESRLRTRIETIMQSMADGLVAVDADLRVLAFNREAETLTGIMADAAIGRPVEKVLEARDAQGDAVRLPIFDLSEGSVGAVMLKRKGGDPVPVAVTSAIVRNDDGDVAGGVAVLRDMTREREIEKMKSEFLSNISHELRTPLTPIKGYAEILSRKEVPPEKTKQFVKGILDSTARLERIVELLVDFSAMEAGRLAPRATPIDLGALVQKVAEDWEKKTPRHSVVAEVLPKLPQVVGDERLIRRSIEEVLDNAVKFSPDGGTIKLEAKGATSETNGRRRQVQVCVTDEGIGITPEDLHKVFSDFHQLDGSETRAYGGLGLGLAFVQRIVEAHAGTITVESEPDQGTTFTISIPAARRARKATKAEPAPRPEEIVAD